VEKCAFIRFRQVIDDAASGRIRQPCRIPGGYLHQRYEDDEMVVVVVEDLRALYESPRWFDPSLFHEDGELAADALDDAQWGCAGGKPDGSTGTILEHLDWEQLRAGLSGLRVHPAADAEGTGWSARTRPATCDMLIFLRTEDRSRTVSPMPLTVHDTGSR
jgi:hypothetical protein